MTDSAFERPSSMNRMTAKETIEFRLLVAILMVISAFVLLGGLVLGRRYQMPFWKEVKSTAYAAAGYAFKY
ncbi:MAG: hypothetical protein AAGF54_17210 [Pseudomonadota bacterium]